MHICSQQFSRVQIMRQLFRLSSNLHSTYMWSRTCIHFSIFICRRRNKINAETLKRIKHEIRKLLANLIDNAIVQNVHLLNQEIVVHIAKMAYLYRMGSVTYGYTGQRTSRSGRQRNIYFSPRSRLLSLKSWTYLLSRYPT